jgi:hypothetical protein
MEIPSERNSIAESLPAGCSRLKCNCISALPGADGIKNEMEGQKIDT